MKKFKLLLIIFLLPFTYIFYYLSSENHGISAYIEKQIQYESIKNKNKLLKKEINSYKNKINLLKKDNIDIDLLEEKAFESLGVTNSGTLVINTKDL